MSFLVVSCEDLIFSIPSMCSNLSWFRLVIADWRPMLHKWLYFHICTWALTNQPHQSLSVTRVVVRDDNSDYVYLYLVSCTHCVRAAVYNIDIICLAVHSRRNQLGLHRADGVPTNMVCHACMRRIKSSCDTASANAILQRQKAVTYYFPSMQMLCFGFSHHVNAVYISPEREGCLKERGSQGRGA